MTAADRESVWCVASPGDSWSISHMGDATSMLSAPSGWARTKPSLPWMLIPEERGRGPQSLGHSPLPSPLALPYRAVEVAGKDVGTRTLTCASSRQARVCMLYLHKWWACMPAARANGAACTCMLAHHSHRIIPSPHTYTPRLVHKASNLGDPLVRDGQLLGAIAQAGHQKAANKI